MYIQNQNFNVSESKLDEKLFFIEFNHLSISCCLQNFNNLAWVLCRKKDLKVKAESVGALCQLTKTANANELCINQISFGK